MQVAEYKQQIEVFKVENSKLKEELDKYRQAGETQFTSILSPDAKVVSREEETERLDISDKIKQQLVALGIKLNST